jgi:hypothetical protein
MDPITLALGIGGIASKIFGAVQGNNEEKKYYDLEKQKADQQKEFADKQIEFLQYAQKLGLATNVDASGNITYYDPQKNSWQTILSPTQRRLQDASDTEQLRSLTTDAGMARSDRINAAHTRALEGDTADTLRNQLNNRLGGEGQEDW